MDIRVGFLALLVAVLGTIAGLLLFPFLQYVIAAGLLAFLLYPLHERLEPKIGTIPSAAFLTVFGLVATVIPLLFISLIVLQTAVEFLQDFDEASAVERLDEFLVERLDIEARFDVTVDDLLSAGVDEVLTPALEQLLREVTSIIGLTIQIGIGLLISIFLLYYFLKDGDELIRWLRTVVPLDQDVITEFLDETDKITWAVLKSHMFVALVEGVLGGIGLWLLGVPNPIFWTIIMVVVSILPAIGIWLVWAPAVAYLFAVGTPLQAGLLLAYGVSVLAVVDNYVRAIMVDRDAGLHPAVVLIGVLGGASVLGIIGLLLGPVLLAVFKASVNVFSREYNPTNAPPAVTDTGSDSATTEATEPETDGSADADETAEPADS